MENNKNVDIIEKLSFSEINESDNKILIVWFDINDSELPIEHMAQFFKSMQQRMPHRKLIALPRQFDVTEIREEDAVLLLQGLLTNFEVESEEE